ncbi:MAG: TRAP transporter small permease [Armatimonadetes bacterium]|nr:TRAP transporter small permease [Armatimonadota bacterium]
MRSLSVIRKCAISIEKHVGTLCTLLAFVAGLALLAIMVVTVINVFLRIPSSPITGTVEISSMLFAIVVAFGIGFTTVKRQHVEVDLITRHLPKRVQSILGVVIGILGLGLWIVLTWRSYLFAVEQYSIGEYNVVLHNMRVAPWRFALVFGLAILCLVLLIQLIQRVAKAVKK